MSIKILNYFPPVHEQSQLSWHEEYDHRAREEKRLKENDLHLEELHKVFSQASKEEVKFYDEKIPELKLYFSEFNIYSEQLNLNDHAEALYYLGYNSLLKAGATLSQIEIWTDVFKRIEIDNISTCIPQAKCLRGFLELIELGADDNTLKIFSDCAALLFCDMPLFFRRAGEMNEEFQIDNVIDSFTNILRNKNNSEKTKSELIEKEYKNVLNIFNNVAKNLKEKAFKIFLLIAKIFPPLLILTPAYFISRYLAERKRNKERKEQTG